MGQAIDFPGNQSLHIARRRQLCQSVERGDPPSDQQDGQVPRRLFVHLGRSRQFSGSTGPFTREITGQIQSPGSFDRKAVTETSPAEYHTIRTDSIPQLKVGAEGQVRALQLGLARGVSPALPV